MHIIRMDFPHVILHGEIAREGTRAHGADVVLLSRMDFHVTLQRAQIFQFLPTLSTGHLVRMNLHVTREDGATFEVFPTAIALVGDLLLVCLLYVLSQFTALVVLIRTLWTLEFQRLPEVMAVDVRLPYGSFVESPIAVLALILFHLIVLLDVTEDHRTHLKRLPAFVALKQAPFNLLGVLIAATALLAWLHGCLDFCNIIAFVIVECIHAQEDDPTVFATDLLTTWT
uniref:Uncharacterized protein n=1 Tax=Lutzomyia longipalpis TaxID=7200 RepID=A0A7G3B7K0_LUTLO